MSPHKKIKVPLDSLENGWKLFGDRCMPNIFERITRGRINHKIQFGREEFGHPAGMKNINLQTVRRNKPKTTKF